jgi:hypothetical protein
VLSTPLRSYPPSSHFSSLITPLSYLASLFSSHNSHHSSPLSHVSPFIAYLSSLLSHRSSLLCPLSSVLSPLSSHHSNSLSSLTYRIPSQGLGTTCTYVRTVRAGEKHEKKGMKVRGLPFYTSTYICLVYIAKVTH